MMRTLAKAAAGLLVAGTCLVAVPEAQAATHTVTVQAFTYNRPVVVVAQGDSLRLRSEELSAAIPHNLREVAQTAPGGQSRFSSPTISAGGNVAVSGVSSLAAGTYVFGCSIHPFMVGDLVVT